MAKILDVASVRIEADSSGAERDARRSGEKAGREFAQGADSELRSARPAPLKVPLDPLTADFERMVRTQLAQLARQVNLRVPVDAEGERLRAQVAAQIRAVESTLRAEIPVEPEAAGFRRKLAALVAVAERTVKANVRVDFDRSALSRLGSLVGTGAQALVDALTAAASAGGDALSGLVDGAKAMGSAVAGKLSELAGSATEMGGTVAGAVSSAADSLAGLASSAASSVPQLALMLAMASLVSAAVGLLAGAVLALGGAVTAGIGGLPVLLTGLIAPIAAVALGFDGIKRAAGVLSEHVTALKVALSDTFERTMAPVFERLHAVFPVLQAGLVGVAEATSLFAGGLVDVITSEAGLRNIEAALAGVGIFLGAALPGAQALLGALLNVAGTTPLYQILGDTIGGLAGRLAGFLNHITETGLLTEALTQLRDVMFGASGALGALTTGALEFFTSAGPGMTAFFDGLQAAFNNIDFDALGASFGTIFAAIGDGLARVPPETWQQLAEAVRAFAGEVQAFVDSGAIDLMVQGFGFLIDIAGEVISHMAAIGFAIQGLNTLLTTNDFGAAAESFKNAFRAMRGEAEIQGQGIVESVSRTSNDAANNFNQNVSRMPLDSARLGAAVTEGMRAGLGPMPNVAGGAGRDTGNILAGALAPMPGQAGRHADDTARRVGGGLRKGEPEASSAGSAMAAGLALAIKLGQSSVIGAAIGIALAAWRAAKNALGSKSPSKLFMRLGDDVVAGFVLGIEGGRPEVRAAMTALARTATVQFDRTLTAGLAGASGTVADSLTALDRAQARARRLSDAVARGEKLVRAEDGSLVPASFYTGGPPGGAAQSAQPAVTPAALSAAFLAALDQAELRFSGDNIAKIVNRTNLGNARR
jgi:hypothetical protein